MAMVGECYPHVFYVPNFTSLHLTMINIINNRLNFGVIVHVLTRITRVHQAEPVTMECVQERGTTGHKQAVEVYEQAIRPR